MGSYETNGSSSQNVLSLWEKPEVLTLQGFQIRLLQSKAETLVGWLSSFCLGPRDVAWGPQTKAECHCSYGGPRGLGRPQPNWGVAWGRGLGGAAALELQSLAVAANGFGRLLGGWRWWP